ncbi:MAG: hypothetical protein UR26_C0010G0014 [candidate division TM6 bacterium GW2011_GWF2_32_72]|nr:MAG: hypothetical protein UR26_C0010G0014 [candidate division TM6 bacterium GW2011_GWF2_32_72]
MKKFIKSATFKTGLAVFSMLFGAGNTMLPISVGVFSGTESFMGILGFLLTAVIIPLAGLFGVLLFDGDYRAFFNRTGKFASFFLIFMSMLILGPLIAMPRIVALSYEMIEHFWPGLSISLFTSVFLIITFLLSYRENKILDILGKYISPILIISLIILIIKGLMHPDALVDTGVTKFESFEHGIVKGYHTLDLFGTIFFASIVLSILSNTTSGINVNNKTIATMGLKAGFIGTFLLAIIYIGLALVGTYNNTCLTHLSDAKQLIVISVSILGNHGGWIVATAILMACISTIIALAAVVAEYIQHEVTREKVSYLPALAIGLAATFLPSILGVDRIMRFSEPLILIAYPVLITMTFLNIAYKLFGFKPMKTPVYIVAILSTIWYGHEYWFFVEIAKQKLFILLGL